MEGQSNNKDVGTVLLMLDNKCLSPCYCFKADGHEFRTMSPEILDEVLEWVSQFKPFPPNTMYMVGAPQELDEEVQEVLEDVADSVICAPMQKTEQDKAGLPFSQTQMIVFPSLADFEKDIRIIRGRSCVVHIGREEISRWSSTIKGLSKDSSVTKMRFRPKNLHLWNRTHLKAYRNQFIELEALKYRLNTAGVLVGWEPSSMRRCPAVRSLVTIGPDGLCYPCPTFYYAGQTNGLGEFKTLDSDRIFSKSPEQTCRLCKSEYCEACLFSESGHAAGEVGVCELPTGQDGDTSWEEIIWNKDRSGYMFEGFKSASVLEVTGEASESLWASEQMNDISLEDFVNALKSINQTAHAVMNGTPEVSENLISEYEKLAEPAPNTRKSAFSYEQLTKSLEDLHLKSGEATYDSVISQYKKSGRSEQVSRKVFFFEKVKEVLLGFVELSEAINKYPLSSKRALLLRYSISHAKEEDETGKLLLSEHEVMSIRQLYEIYLGWLFLYDSLTEELKHDLNVDREMIEVTQEKMIEAKVQMSHWFNETSKQHKWESREGYNFLVDFESNLNVSRASYQKILHGDPKSQNENWIQITELDGIEKEVIERLTMIMQSSLTKVKQRLSQHLAGLDVERDLGVSIKTLGHDCLDLARWYTGMAKEYNWPPYLRWRITNNWIVEGK